MLEHARVVIVGGGSLGVSLLYHLTKEGWTDILLIESTYGNREHQKDAIDDSELKTVILSYQKDS